MQVHRRPYRAALRAATAVVGVGTTEFGNLTGSSADDLGLAALEAALDDAGLTARDLDGLIVNRVSSYETVASRMGIEPRWTAQLPAEGRMTGIAIQMAVLAITTGMASTIALVYGNNGRSGGHTYGAAARAPARPPQGYGTNPALTLPYGMTSPGAFYAMMFQRHCAQYGTTAEQLAQVAVTLRDHASLNPHAVFKDPISREIYLESRFIVEPLKIYDYCLINDGGVAMISPRRTGPATALNRPCMSWGSDNKGSYATPISPRTTSGARRSPPQGSRRTQWPIAAGPTSTS